jgi:hypothetical protein
MLLHQGRDAVGVIGMMMSQQDRPQSQAALYQCFFDRLGGAGIDYDGVAVIVMQ